MKFLIKMIVALVASFIVALGSLYVTQLVFPLWGNSQSYQMNTLAGIIHGLLGTVYFIWRMESNND